MALAILLRILYALDFIRENITILKWKLSSFDFKSKQNKREVHEKRQLQNDTQSQMRK